MTRRHEIRQLMRQQTYCPLSLVNMCLEGNEKARESSRGESPGSVSSSCDYLMEVAGGCYRHGPSPRGVVHNPRGRSCCWLSLHCGLRSPSTPLCFLPSPKMSILKASLLLILDAELPRMVSSEKPICSRKPRTFFEHVCGMTHISLM